MTETVEDTIVMKCEVVADLSLEMDVTWKKDNLDFEENDRIQQNDDHSLTIQNLTFDDSGWNVSLFDPISLCFVHTPTNPLSNFAKRIHYKFKQKL